jgi:S1-C subfamily serine protease
MASVKPIIRFDNKEDYTLVLTVFVAFILLFRLITIPAPLETPLSDAEKAQIAASEEISTSESTLYATYASASDYLAKLESSLIPATPCKDRLTEFTNQKDFLYYLDYEVSRMKDISGLGSCLTFSGFPQHLLPEVSRLAPKLETAVVEVQAGFSFGTGYAIAEDLIATNFHVATEDNNKPHSKFTLTAVDGKKYDATYVGGNMAADVAILKVKTKMVGVTPVVLAESESSSLNYGQPVFSIGHPSGFGMWKTLVGVYYGEKTNLYNTPGPRFSLPSVSGSSGSPIFNMDGELVAMMYGATPIAEARVQTDPKAQYRSPIHTGIVSDYSVSSGVDLLDIKKAIEEYVPNDSAEPETDN